MADLEKFPDAFGDFVELTRFFGNENTTATPVTDTDYPSDSGENLDCLYASTYAALRIS